MSPEAVARQLRKASELRDLCLSLQKAKAAAEQKRRPDENDSTDKKQNLPGDVREA